MTNLPKMVVEQRESTTAHGIPVPDFDFRKQLNEAIEFNNEARVSGWDSKTIEKLKSYIPIPVSSMDIKESIKEVMGFNDWREVTIFAQDDECLEFFNLALKYCKRQGQVHQRDKDFIDGSGIGYVKAYTNRLKATLEKCFDAKWFYRLQRPLEFSANILEVDLSNVANYIHPGHWSYPAGHGTKFLTAVEVLNDVFHLDKDCYRNLFIAACVASMARSGSLIHYPIDNLAGGVLTTLKEFN